jgi:hypothetical protein
MAVCEWCEQPQPGSLEDLTVAKNYWQKQLRLQDWNIAIRFAHDIELDGDESEGTCAIWEKSKEAEVSIIYPDEYPKDAVFAQNIQRTIVHELLHIHFHFLRALPGSAATQKWLELQEEQAVTAISYGLLPEAQCTCLSNKIPYSV